MMRRLLLVLILAILAGGLFVGSASATPAEMMDTEWLGPHSSDIAGEMVQDCWRWYGIPPHVLLTIIGCETSMGDPVLGGRLVQYHNYGCLRFGSGGFWCKWGALASGTVEVGGRVWCAYPSMEQGMMALGRLLKVGPVSDPGYYLRCFKRGDWAAFAAVWNPAGGQRYVEKLRKLDATLCRVAARWGYLW